MVLYQCSSYCTTSVFFWWHYACSAWTSFHRAVQVVVKVHLGAAVTAEPSPTPPSIPSARMAITGLPPTRPSNANNACRHSNSQRPTPKHWREWGVTSSQGTVHSAGSAVDLHRMKQTPSQTNTTNLLVQYRGRIPVSASSAVGCP